MKSTCAFLLIFGGSLLSWSSLATTASPEGQWARLAAQIIGEEIVPMYQRVSQTAKRHRDAMEDLCRAPNEDRLHVARQSLGSLIAAFSRAAVVRIGPIRKQYRLERFMSWPDPRGRSLQKIRRTLQNRDAMASDRQTLVKKSIAVQGLVAQDYLLFGNGADSMAGESLFRCRYAQANAEMMVDMSRDVLDDWDRVAGLDGQKVLSTPVFLPEFKSHAEFIQGVLKSLAEKADMVGKMKIQAVLGLPEGQPKLKQAAFWRSGNTLADIHGNMEGIRRISSSLAWNNVPQTEALRVFTILSAELDFARRPLHQLEHKALQGDALSEDHDVYDQIDYGDATEEISIDVSHIWFNLMEDQDAFDQLAYVASPVAAIAALIRDQLMPALGLTPGFNSLDGD